MAHLFSYLKKIINGGNSQQQRLDLIASSNRYNPSVIRLYRAIYLGEVLGPERLMISPTNVCNIACSICWRHKERPEDLKRVLNEKPMSLETIEAIIADAAEMGTKTVDFTGGGEPFTRKDLFEIAAIIKKYGLEASLTTNGTLIDEPTALRIVDSGLDDICFSLDSLDPEINAAIRGAGVLEKTVQAINLVNKAKQQHSSKTPVLRMSSVITSVNYAKLPDLVEFASRNGIVAINFMVLAEWPTNKEFWVAHREAEVRPSLQRIAEQARTLGIYTNIEHIMTHGLGKHAPPVACYAPWLMAFINAAGSVMFCCTLATQYSNVLGNIYEQRFSELWRSDKCDQFRTHVLQGQFPEECSLCLPDFTSEYNELHEQLQALRREVAGS